jgi:CHAT domain-containing protein/Tfp pilus assembly protein PilF
MRPILLPVALASLLSLTWPSPIATAQTQQSAQADALQRARQLAEQALQLYEQGDYQGALVPAEEALKLRQENLPEDDPSIATSLNNVAALYQFLGRYDQAATLMQRALEIASQNSGVNNLEYATGLNNLAEVYRAQGNYIQAEELYLKSIAIREALLPPTDIAIAIAYNNLAELYRAQGNIEQARSLYEKALQISRLYYREDHPFLINILNNLGELHRSQNSFSQAADLYREALQIARQTLGTEHPYYAGLMNNMATLHLDAGLYEKAISLFLEVIPLTEQQFGYQHPYMAQVLENLAGAYYYENELEQAKPLFQQAIAIREQVLGNTHPDLARGLNRLSQLYRTQGKIEQAIDLLSRATTIEEHNLSITLTTGTEARKQAYINTLEESTYATLSLNLQQAPQNLRATRLALTTLLQRKGRVLDTLTDSQNNLRKYLNPSDQQLLGQLSEKRSQLAASLFGGTGNDPNYQQELTDLRTQIQDLEQQLSQRNAQFQTQTQPITLNAVQQFIPDGAALIEFSLYRPLIRRVQGTSQWGEPRYAAYILNTKGDPQCVDLGTAAELDQAIAQFRNALRDRRYFKKFQEAARALDAKLMEPIRPLLGDATQLLISPDGQLNLLPFAALIDPQKKYALENYTISYLTSGRDLLRLQTPSSQQRDVLFANPQFGDSRQRTQDNSRQGNSSRLDTLEFGPLPGTAAEINAIAPLLPNALVLSENLATEAQLKQVQAPRILHIATHGFFLENEGSANTEPNDQPPGDNPLLRSGLALAGFNQRQSVGDENDGVFTALEASGLNLWGTQLVVLSACETGVGEVSNGEGVYGLRRAFVMAGTASQVLSLWQVDDFGTQDLMVKYYQQLLAGKGRSEALRHTQLEMLKSDRYQHPYYWSVFNLSGDWRSLQ